MAARNAHIIQRQVLELSTAKLRANLGFQDNSADLLQKVINPAIEACFNGMVGDDQHLVIDKLEIDLGIFTPETIEQEAPLRLSDILGNLLRSYHEAATAKDGSHHNIRHEKGFISSGNQADFPSGTPAGWKPASAAGLFNQTQSLHHALLYFLTTGRLPWWQAAETSNQAWSEANTLDACFTPGWTELPGEREKSSLKESLVTTPAARTRMVNHFSAEWISRLLDALGLKGMEGLRQWKIIAAGMQAVAGYSRRLHQFFWIAWIEALYSGNDSIDLSRLVALTAGGDQQAAGLIASHLYEQCRQHISEPVFAGYATSIREYFPAGSKTNIPGIYVPGEPEETADQFFTSKPRSGNETGHVAVNMSSAQVEAKEGTGAGKNKIADDDAVFVEAAGIVILHPFFAELFKETGLWDGEKWIAQDSQHRGLQLLAWLGFGETGLPEYRLTLLKILTGLDIEDPLPAFTPLTQPELKACTELLQAVVMHWKALRSTSTEGLQQGFLQREGKLSETAKGYQLVVERKAQDVLLAQLPWGYGMISLPWMEKIMNITWI